jgi:hypothetical protein
MTRTAIARIAVRPSEDLKSRMAAEKGVILGSTGNAATYDAMARLNSKQKPIFDFYLDFRGKRQALVVVSARPWTVRRPNPVLGIAVCVVPRVHALLKWAALRQETA